jgi:CRISPR-associated protein Cas5h
MLGLKIKVDCVNFVTFRKPASTSLIASYVIPPYTTIRGMLSNALGLERNNLFLQDRLKIGIVPHNLQKSWEMAKILKLKGNSSSFLRVFPSSPVFKEFLVMPKYEIFLVGEESIIHQLHRALLEPKRPLYLGSSDDLVDLEVFHPQEVREAEVNSLNCVVPFGVYENSIIERVPYKFIKKGKEYFLEYKTVAVPKNGNPLTGNFRCFIFDNSEPVAVL